MNEVYRCEMQWMIGGGIGMKTQNSYIDSMKLNSMKRDKLINNLLIVSQLFNSIIGSVEKQIDITRFYLK